MMIAFFPTPLPDELFYSVVVRYHIQSKNKSAIHSIEDLFGTRNHSIAVDFPYRFNDLISRLHPKTNLTAEELIEATTLLPLHRPFLDKEVTGRILETMKATIAFPQQLSTMVGKNSGMESLKYLRFCRSCIDDDLKKYGTPYWHRSHQVSGVEMCSIHQDWLLESEELSSGIRNRNHFCIPFRSMNGSSLRREEKNHQTSLLRRVSEDVSFFMNGNIAENNYGDLLETYHRILFDLGFSMRNKRVQFKNLEHSFGKEYQWILDSFNSIPIGKSNWLRRMLGGITRSVHPVRHLLFMYFLGFEPKDLVRNIVSEPLPFGSGPWVCLNPAAEHYREKIITSCDVTFKSKEQVPTGIFTCSCGFKYRRTGPDKHEDDMYKKDRIIEFGHIWERELLRLCVHEKQNKNVAAKQLGVKYKTVTTQLNKLELESLGYCASKVRIESRRDIERKLWLQTIDQFPNTGVTEIRKHVSKTYSWLYENDNEWLFQHCPKKIKSPKRDFSKVDWELRDKEYYKRVLDAISRIKSEKKPMRRVTLFSISQAIGYQKFKINVGKMPITNDLVQASVETVEDFQIRRLAKVAQELVQNGQSIVRWKLIEKANVFKPSDRIELFIQELIREAQDVDVKLYSDYNQIVSGQNNEKTSAK